MFVLILIGGLLVPAAAAWLLDVGWLVNFYALLSILGAAVNAWAKLKPHGAKPSAWTVLTATSAAAVYSWILVWLDTAWYWKAFLLAILATPIMSLANAGFRRDLRRAQKVRDGRASVISKQVVSGVDPPGGFTLYLRPFASADRLGVQALPSEFAVGDVPTHLDFESLLRRAVEDDHPLVGLGRPGDTTEGAARIATDDDEWQSMVIQLIARAALIVLVPMSRKGTIWELRHIVDTGMLHKVVLAMPETVAPIPSGVIHFTEETDRLFDDVGIKHYSHAEHSLNFEDEWEAARRDAAGMHLQLPPYAHSGALFTIDPQSRRVDWIVPLPLSTMARRVSALKLILSGLAKPATATSSIDETAISAIRRGIPMRRGRTLEYNLVRGADAFVQWERPAVAASLLREAAHAGRHRCPITRWYLAALPDFAIQANEFDKPEVSARYALAARLFAADSHLRGLINLRSAGSRRPDELSSQ